MSFYITLPSNVISSSFSNNSIANYVTILSQRMNLYGEWSVGLSEISYTKSWYNILKSNKISLFDELRTIYEKHVTLLPGYYESGNKLVNTINDLLSNVGIKDIKPPQLGFNTSNSKVVIKPGEKKLGKKPVKVYLEFDDELKSILGFNNTDKIVSYSMFHNKRNSDANHISNALKNNIIYDMPNDMPNESPKEVVAYSMPNDMVTIYDNIFGYEYFEASRPLEISTGHHNLYVYLNIGFPSHIGNTCAQILRVVEVPNKEFGEQCVRTYDNPQYRLLMLNEFYNIEVSIKDDCGELIPFKFGRVIVTLHFKKL